MTRKTRGKMNRIIWEIRSTKQNVDKEELPDKERAKCKRENNVEKNRQKMDRRKQTYEVKK